MSLSQDDDAEAVLTNLMDSGAFDELRQQLVQHLKQNEELKRVAEEGVLNSKDLPLPGADKKTKRDAFEAIRRSLQEEVLSKALKATWEVLNSADLPVAAAIDDHTHKALCAVYEERERQQRGLPPKQ